MRKKSYKAEKGGYYSGVVLPKNVAREGMICGHTDVELFQTCKWYNTEFCLNSCTFRATNVTSFDFDNWEDGK